jgi:hypothetical protein
MKSLYCPKCNSYLEGGSGDMVDCHCGWEQPEDAPEPEDFNQEFYGKTMRLLQHILEVLPQEEVDKIDNEIWCDVQDFKNE